MKSEHLKINNIAAIKWGDASENVFLYVHGKGGCKEEAESLAFLAQNIGYQVLSIDLPGYGERKSEIEKFNPWDVISELQEVMCYIKANWKKTSLFAQSIGAYFSMLALKNENFFQTLFVSPIVDMEYLINRMMLWANVSKEMLEKEKIIPTDFGESLSIDYLKFVESHPIDKWNAKTAILYGEKDNLMEQNIVENFAKKFSCNLTVMKNGEHWFHTPEELEFLKEWSLSNIKKG